MTKQDILTTIRSGVPVRWLPKSVIYNDVRGHDTRRLFVGKKMLSTIEEFEVYCLLHELVVDGLVKCEERGRFGSYRENAR